eukprot:6207387-Pleurochrysis_carterae.AAC.2
MHERKCEIWISSGQQDRWHKNVDNNRRSQITYTTDAIACQQSQCVDQLVPNVDMCHLAAHLGFCECATNDLALVPSFQDASMALAGKHATVKALMAATAWSWLSGWAAYSIPIARLRAALARRTCATLDDTIR